MSGMTSENDTTLLNIPTESLIENDITSVYDINAPGLMTTLSANQPAIHDDPDTDPCDVQPYYYTDYTQISFVQYTFVFCYIFVITVSLFGNFFVIWTVWKHKHMRTGTNIYIVNLAVSDLLVAAFVMPLKLLEYAAPCSWKVFSQDPLCSFVSFMLPVFVFASVLTLVAISVDRFYAVIYPLKRKTSSGGKRRQIYILLGTWIIAILLSLPYLYCRSYAFNIESEFGMVSRQICTDRFDDIDEWWYGETDYTPGTFRKGFFLFLFVVVYVTPSVIIMYTCIRMAMGLVKTQDFPVHGLDQRMAKNQADNKRRVARIVIFVSLAFIVSWTPFYLVNFVSQIQGSDNFLRRKNFLFIMISTHLVGFINSCINPLIYITMSKKFRRSFLMMIRCIPIVRRRRQQWALDGTSVRSSDAQPNVVAQVGCTAAEPILRYTSGSMADIRSNHIPVSRKSTPNGVVRWL